jgi:16S rRNA (cytosine1402-N4)-methyltransferase
MDYGKHTSVLLEQCLEYLSPEVANPSYLDLTFGGGGHFFSFQEKFQIKKCVGVDQDNEAYINGLQQIKDKGLEKFSIIYHENFHTHLDSQNYQNTFSIILADIGVSSHHFDMAERGFSFANDGPLDMRMDQRQEFSAKSLVNDYSAEDIEQILRDFGEERFANRISERIVEQRKVQEINTTKQLEEICFLCYPVKSRHKKPHPATRTFQALRIAVNRELEVLEKSIDMMLAALEVNGKLGIISFHSLEDRIVKHSFKRRFLANKSEWKILTKRPLIASDEEIKNNPRSRSAKLRVIQKI